MKYLLHIFLFLPLVLQSLYGQQPNTELFVNGTSNTSTNELIAEDYYKRAEFEKALLSYQKLFRVKPYSFKFLYKIIDIFQQMERYQEADAFIRDNLVKFRNPALLVELGYNHQLRDSIELAQAHYAEAIEVIDTNPNFVYGITKRFEKHSLLDEAIRSYEKAAVLMPDKNFNIQLARIYGELGDIEKMFQNYLDYVAFKPNFMNNAKRAFNDFITENPENNSNQSLRRLLLRKLQASPDIQWYELLSWLYVQERQYQKSFVQERAIYKRYPESLDRLFELASFALEDNDDSTAEAIFNFVLETAKDLESQLVAHQYLLEIHSEKASAKDLINIQKAYLDLFDRYGLSQLTIDLQISYADFLAFYLKTPPQASVFLKNTLKSNMSAYQRGLVKLKLGDILVLEEKFNEALIYFTQIQSNLKNSTLSQEARFKVAKTSYYKGDFDWAESQLKILKSSTSQLIANDALELKLLISDNKYEDSTRTALKLYAKADLLAYQKKTTAAIATLDNLLKAHKGETIIDEALYKQARLYEELANYSAAADNYLRIIADYREDILIDDAYFRLAQLYQNFLNLPEEAKSYYEKIIFEQEDSIYFVEARKQYRLLRGDAIE